MIDKLIDRFHLDMLYKVTPLKMYDSGCISLSFSTSKMGAKRKYTINNVVSLVIINKSSLSTALKVTD